MLLDLKPLFAGSREFLSVESELDLSELNFLGVKPLPSPVAISGKIVSRAGIVESQLDCKISYVGFCDRCLKETVIDYVVKINRTIVVSIEDQENEENDDIAVVPDMQLNLDDFCYDDIVMSLPTKVLCRADCRGFCPDCGKDLNLGSCDCGKKEVDPRLAVLAELLKD